VLRLVDGPEVRVFVWLRLLANTGVKQHPSPQLLSRLRERGFSGSLRLRDCSLALIELRYVEQNLKSREFYRQSPLLRLVLDKGLNEHDISRREGGFE